MNFGKKLRIVITIYDVQYGFFKFVLRRCSRRLYCKCSHLICRFYVVILVAEWRFIREDINFGKTQSRIVNLVMLQKWGREKKQTKTPIILQQHLRIFLCFEDICRSVKVSSNFITKKSTQILYLTKINWNAEELIT